MRSSKAANDFLRWRPYRKGNEISLFDYSADTLDKAANKTAKPGYPALLVAVLSQQQFVIAGLVPATHEHPASVRRLAGARFEVCGLVGLERGLASSPDTIRVVMGRRTKSGDNGEWVAREWLGALTNLQVLSFRVRCQTCRYWRI